MTKAMEEGEIEAKKVKAARPIDQDPLYIQLQERMQRVQDERDRIQKTVYILQDKLNIAAMKIKELEEQVVETLPIPELVDVNYADLDD